MAINWYKAVEYTDIQTKNTYLQVDAFYGIRG